MSSLKKVKGKKSISKEWQGGKSVRSVKVKSAECRGMIIMIQS